jgi:hypothetical protein
MPPILAVLGRIAGSIEAVTGTLKTIAGVMNEVVNLGLYGAGGVTLKIAENVFSKIEQTPFFKKFDINFGSKYMTPFGTVLYWNEIQKQIFTANRQLGVAGMTSKQIERNIISAGTASMQFGFSEQEIVQTYQNFIEDYGRNTIFSDEDLERLTKINYAFGQSYNQIFSLTKLYGASIEQTYGFMETLNKEVDKYGLNTKRVYSDIQNNIRLIDRFNFKNGIQGLSQMVVQANRLGMKIEDIAGFAEKIYNPEDAIDAAASLQMLGGEFAKLGDPFSLMYDANNDLEGLTQKLRDITKGMGALNKETGMVDLSSLEMRQLREFSKITGQSLQDLAQQAKLMRKEDLITQALSPNMKQFGDIEKYITKLAGMADFTGGVPTITLENQQKLVSDLSTADLEKLSQVSVSASGDSFEGLILSNQTLADKMAIFSQEFTRAINAYQYVGAEVETLNKILVAGNESLRTGKLDKTAAFINESKLGAAKSFDRVITPAIEGDMSSAFGNWWDNMDMQNKINSQVIDSLTNLLGPNSVASKMVDGLVSFQSGLHNSIGWFGSKVDQFGNWVGDLVGGKKSNNQNTGGTSSNTQSTTSNISSLSLANQSSFVNETATLKLFKENESARKEMEKQLLQTSSSTLKVEAANSSHKIEFSWNGKVYNVYDLFDDPKFKEMLKKDMGEAMANNLLSHYSNGGKNTVPKSTTTH